MEKERQDGTKTEGGETNVSGRVADEEESHALTHGSFITGRHKLKRACVFLRSSTHTGPKNLRELVRYTSCHCNFCLEKDAYGSMSVTHLPHRAGREKQTLVDLSVECEKAGRGSSCHGDT